MNKRKAIVTTAFAMIIIACVVVDSRAQRKGQLIINPRLKGPVGVMPIRGGEIVRSDTLTGARPNKGVTSYPGRTYFEGVEESAAPAPVLIVGFVPDPTRRWAVAYTHDAREFEEALPEYLKLMREGKRIEARRKLFISDDIAVSTSVDLFTDRQKIRDLPEKIGSFHMIVSNSTCERHGYHLTFLSYAPDMQKRLHYTGSDLGELVHGSVRLRVENDDKGRGVLVMDVIEADIRETGEPE